MQQLMPKFLVHVLQTTSAKEQISASTHAADVPKLALSRIEQIQIPLPSIVEQQAIVTEVEALEAQIAQAREVMAGCEERKSAVLHRYLD